jgi:hypothetical protein
MIFKQGEKLLRENLVQKYVKNLLATSPMQSCETPLKGSKSKAFDHKLRACSTITVFLWVTILINSIQFF